MLEHSTNVCEKILNTKTHLHFYEASMLEYSRNVRFWGRKDLMKVTHSVLEYKVLIRTPHAGIKYKCACKLTFFLPLCAYSVLEHNIFLTGNRGITGTKLSLIHI